MEKDVIEYDEAVYEACEFVQANSVPFDWTAPFELVIYADGEWLVLEKDADTREVLKDGLAFFIVQNDIYYWPATFQVHFAGPDAQKVM